VQQSYVKTARLRKIQEAAPRGLNLTRQGKNMRFSGTTEVVP